MGHGTEFRLFLHAPTNMYKAIVLISFSLECFTLCFGQHNQARVFKTKAAPRMDGILDEDAWREASSASGFITNTPSFGMTSTDRTEVWVLYDNTSIYIGAHLYGDPKLIRRQFTPRDQERMADVDY